MLSLSNKRTLKGRLRQAWGNGTCTKHSSLRYVCVASDGKESKQEMQHQGGSPPDFVRLKQRRTSAFSCKPFWACLCCPRQAINARRDEEQRRVLEDPSTTDEILLSMIRNDVANKNRRRNSGSRNIGKRGDRALLSTGHRRHGDTTDGVDFYLVSSDALSQPGHTCCREVNGKPLTRGANGDRDSISGGGGISGGGLDGRGGDWDGSCDGDSRSRDGEDGADPEIPAFVDAAIEVGYDSADPSRDTPVGGKCRDSFRHDLRSKEVIYREECTRKDHEEREKGNDEGGEKREEQGKEKETRLGGQVEGVPEGKDDCGASGEDGVRRREMDLRAGGNVGVKDDSNNLSDATWSSSDGSDGPYVATTIGSSGRDMCRRESAFGVEADDLAGPAVYGSDDDCRHDVPPAASFAATAGPSSKVTNGHQRGTLKNKMVKSRMVVLATNTENNAVSKRSLVEDESRDIVNMARNRGASLTLPRNGAVAADATPDTSPDEMLFASQNPFMSRSSSRRRDDSALVDSGHRNPAWNNSIKNAIGKSGTRKTFGRVKESRASLLAHQRRASKAIKAGGVDKIGKNSDRQTSASPPSGPELPRIPSAVSPTPPLITASTTTARRYFPHQDHHSVSDAHGVGIGHGGNPPGKTSHFRRLQGTKVYGGTVRREEGRGGDNSSGSESEGRPQDYLVASRGSGRAPLDGRDVRDKRCMGMAKQKERKERQQQRQG